MTDGLIMAYLLDGKGNGKPMDWLDIKAWQPEDGLLWLHLDYKHPRVIQWLKDDNGFDELTAEVLLADESRPRYFMTPDGLLAILRGVNLNPGANPEDMVSIRILVNENRIVTCRKRHLALEESLKQIIERGRGPKTSGDFLAELADQLVLHMSDVIEDLETKTDMLTDQVIIGNTRMLRIELADTKRAIISIRRYLSPQREALVRLSNAEPGWLTAKDRAWLREVADQTIRYLEDLDSARDRATVTQEELTHRLSERTEKRMYLLTIVTTIFLPLGFLTGLLGINVAGIPGTEYKGAFLIVCLVLIVTAIIEIIVLKWRKWF